MYVCMHAFLFLLSWGDAESILNEKGNVKDG